MERTQIIKKMIDATGISVRAFSEEAQVPYTTVRSILERGIGNASVDNVIKICKALGITVEELETVSEFDGAAIEAYIDRYKRKLDSLLARKLLNAEFIDIMSKAKGISIYDAVFLVKQIILRDKIDFGGINTRSSERLIDDIMEVIPFSDDDVNKNIAKVSFMHIIERINTGDYDKGELGDIIKKAREYLRANPSFIDLIRETPQLEFLMSHNEDPMNTNLIKNADIRDIARAGEKMSSDEAAELRKFAERLFPDAFKQDS